LDQSFSLSEALKEELKCPVVFRRRILSSLPQKVLVVGADEEEEDCLNHNTSPLLAKMNLKISAEESKSSNKCGKIATSVTSDDYI
jgi:hypothetical protein